MVRKMLTNRQWKAISPLLPGKPSDPGRTAENNRATLEGILWVARTGAPWRDLPEKFGTWNTVHRRFRRWVTQGVFDRIFESTNGSLDLRAVMVDGSFVKVHQHASGAPKEDAHLMSLPSSRQLDGAAVG